MKIVSAKYLCDYIIEINFSDDSGKYLDFEPFLSKSQHPAIRKYLNRNYSENLKSSMAI
jgi:hypothetical protein